MHEMNKVITKEYICYDDITVVQEIVVKSAKTLTVNYLTSPAFLHLFKNVSHCFLRPKRANIPHFEDLWLE